MCVYTLKQHLCQKPLIYSHTQISLKIITYVVGNINYIYIYNKIIWLRDWYLINIFIVSKANIGIGESELKMVWHGEHRQPSNIAHHCPLKPVFIHIALYCPVGLVILKLPGFLPTLLYIYMYLAVCMYKTDAYWTIINTSYNIWKIEKPQSTQLVWGLFY